MEKKKNIFSTPLQYIYMYHILCLSCNDASTKNTCWSAETQHASNFLFTWNTVPLLHYNSKQSYQRYPVLPCWTTEYLPISSSLSLLHLHNSSLFLLPAFPPLQHTLPSICPSLLLSHTLQWFPDGESAGKWEKTSGSLCEGECRKHEQGVVMEMGGGGYSPTGKNWAGLASLLEISVQQRCYVVSPNRKLKPHWLPGKSGKTHTEKSIQYIAETYWIFFFPPDIYLWG